MNVPEGLTRRCKGATGSQGNDAEYAEISRKAQKNETEIFSFPRFFRVFRVPKFTLPHERENCGNPFLLLRLGVFARA
jgi:hypothetical protein